MAGYTRMTYSLAVILMETGQVLNLFVPIVFSIMISNQVGYIFTRSLYERATRGKQMPILSEMVPPPCEGIICGNIMSKNVVCLKNVDSVANIMRVLKTKHHTFPLLNIHGNIVGLIPRNFIMVLLKN